MISTYSPAACLTVSREEALRIGFGFLPAGPANSTRRKLDNVVLNLVGRLARRSFARVQLRQKSTRGTSQAFRLLSCVFRHVGEGSERIVGNVRNEFGEIRNVVS